MRLPAPDHLAVLSDPLTWSDNPFALRAERADIKRKQPVRIAGGMAVAMTIALIVAYLGLSWMRGNGYSVPWYLGEDIGTTLCILFCGVHFWFVLFTAQRHTTFMLSREAFRNTLSGLLMLPETSFHILFLSILYPWRSAMRVALAGLPLYVLCIGLGGVTWADIAMLYLCFALISLALPVWRKPARSEQAAVITSLQPAKNSLFGSTFQKSAQAQLIAAQSAAGGGAQTYSTVASFFSMIFPMIMVLRMVAGSNNWDAYLALTAYIPHDLLVLLPTFMISWPLIAARGLMTPLGWYGLTLMPLIWAPFMLLAARYVQMVQVSEYLSVGFYRDLAKQSTYLSRRKLMIALRLAFLFVLIGYFWPWAVRDGGLARLVSNQGAVATGLEGYSYLLLFSLYLVLIVRADALSNWARLRPDSSQEIVRRRIGRANAMRYLATPVVFMSALILFGCLLSGYAGDLISAGWLIGRMSAIAAGGVILGYGARRLFGSNVALLFPFLVLLIALGGSRCRDFAILSPALGLLSLGNRGLLGQAQSYLPILPWQEWAWGGALIGVCLLAVAKWRDHRIEGSRAKRKVVEMEPILTLDPTVYGPEPFQDTGKETSARKEKEESLLASFLVRGIERVWDNAVLTKELRTRLRKVNLSTLQGPFLLYLAVTLAAQLYPPLLKAIGSAMGRGLYGTMPSGAQTLAGTVILWYFVLFPVGIGSIFATMATAVTVFSTERDKSTLGFVLLTPLSSWRIVLGKALAVLLQRSLILVSLALWTLALSLALAASVGVQAVSVWAEIMLSCFACWITLEMVAIACAGLFKRPQFLFAGCYLMIFLPQILGQIMMSSARRATFTSRPVRTGPLLQFPDWHILWYIYLGLCLAATIIAALVARWSVERMRHRDMAFEATKRGN